MCRGFSIGKLWALVYNQDNNFQAIKSGIYKIEKQEENTQNTEKN